MVCFGRAWLPARAASYLAATLISPNKHTTFFCATPKLWGDILWRGTKHALRPAEAPDLLRFCLPVVFLLMNTWSLVASEVWNKITESKLESHSQENTRIKCRRYTGGRARGAVVTPLVVERTRLHSIPRIEPGAAPGFFLRNKNSLRLDQFQASVSHA
jgi:hypothetical protein